MMGTRRWCSRAGLALFFVCLGLLLATADRRLLLLARNTLWLSLGACLISLPCGTLLACAVARTDLPLRRSAWVGLIALLCLPLYLHATAWEAGFGKLGWLSLAGQSLGAPLLRGWIAAIWIQGVWGIPWVALIVAAALQLSEPELEEGALLDASLWRVFCTVTLRRAGPGIVVAAIWIALATASEMTVTDLYQIRTLSEELYTGFALSTGGDATCGAGAAVLFTLMLTGLAMATLDAVIVAAAHVPERPAFCFPLGRWRWPVAVLVVVALVVLAGVPLSNLVYQAGIVVQRVDDHPVRYWSLRRFAELLVPWPGTYRVSALWQFSAQFRWTLLIGATAATLSAAIAALLAWWARRGGWWAVPAALVAALGLSTMGPLIGLALVWLFTLSDTPWLVWCYSRTISAPVLAATLRAVPLPILICWVAFGTLSSETIEAAALDGAGPLSRWLRIGMGQRRSALILAWLVALVIACGELSATILATPPGLETVPIRVFGLIHAGVSNQVAAVCLTSVIGFAVIAALVTSVKPARWLGRHAG